MTLLCLLTSAILAASAEIILFTHSAKTLEPLKIEKWLIHQVETLVKFSIKWKPL